MKTLTKILILATLVVTINSCDNLESESIETIENLDYNESLTYANRLNEDLSTFFNGINLSNQKINEDALVQDFIDNYADETIASILSELDENGKMTYEKNYSKSEFVLEDLNGLELSAIEKSYLTGLYQAASSENSGRILEMLDSFKVDATKNPELENLNLIFAFIETNQADLFAHKNSISAKGDCTKAAETGGIIGGVFGMIRGAIAGGITGTVLGLNPGTGAAGAVVGAVGGGVVGFAEGAVLGYIGCKIFG